MKPITSSATAFAFTPGMWITRMPRSRVASRSMLSMPLVPCAISSSCGAASSTGRVLSPNDVFRNFSPWNMGRPLDVTHAQNSLLNDPPTAYYTLLALAKSDPRTFHWNPYIAAGVPGFGSSAAATLTPFAFLPLLVPLPWLYTAMAFLKLNASFVFAYLWLREERLGRRGAAIGALIFAGAGVYSVRWLWQITNTT